MIERLTKVVMIERLTIAVTNTALTAVAQHATTHIITTIFMETPVCIGIVSFSVLLSGSSGVFLSKATFCVVLHTGCMYPSVSPSFMESYVSCIDKYDKV